MRETLASALAFELRGLGGNLGGAAGVGLWAASIALAGWGIPQWVGIAFFDPSLLMIYAGMATQYAAVPVCFSVCADAGRRRSPAALHAKTVVAVVFAFVSLVALVLARAAVVNQQFPSTEFLLPETRMLVRTFAVGAGMAVFGGALAALVAVHSTSARSAMQIVRTAFLVVLLAAVVTARKTGNFWIAAFIPPAGAALAAAGILILRWVSRNPRYSGGSELA